jgi:hypothetical protein|nr:hypothetical protein [Neorhizobium tomejilense]
MKAAERKPEAPLTAGNALYLAKRLGAEHVSNNRTLFNLISQELFQGYAECIRQPIDNNWRRMPYATDLFKAAEEGFRAVDQRGDGARLARLKISMTNRMREVLLAAVPKLDGVIDDPSLILTQRIVTELMEMRFRGVRSVHREEKGFIRGLFAGRKAEYIHANFLREAADSDLMSAYAKVAQNVANEALRGVDHEHMHELVGDAMSLISGCLAAEVEDADLWSKLKQAESALEETGMVTPTISVYRHASSPSL